MSILGDQNLTGATRYRTGWFGGLILQVEERYQVGLGGRPRLGSATHGWMTRWRDAVANDLGVLAYLESYATHEKEGRPPPPPPQVGL